jgi:hypothetical protein
VSRNPWKLLILGAILGTGYLWGRYDAVLISEVSAQDSSTPADETQRKIQAANDALKIAMEALKAESLYTPATRNMNVYGVLTGGLNAVDDLESGRGVDPETFADLYSGQASDEVLGHLGKDDQGRLTYKNKIVRLYPVSRLKRDYNKRLLMTGEVLRTAEDEQQ